MFKIEDLAGLVLQNKGFPAIGWISTPRNGSVVQGKAMKATCLAKEMVRQASVFFETTISKKLNFLEAVTYVQKKGCTAICYFPNPPDGSLARAKSVGCDAFGRGGGER